MRAIVVVNMDGPAFEKDGGRELLGVLLELAHTLSQGEVLLPGTLRLYDSKGDACGRLTISRSK